jgi:hypothetical protein
MRVTIIGVGSMGRGIGTRLVVGGNDVELIDNDPEDARVLAEELAGQGGSSATPLKDGPPGGEVIAFALPYRAAAGVVAEYGGQLAGRVVVDISNPVDFTTMDDLLTPPESSAAEELAALLTWGLRRARQLEYLGFLHISLQDRLHTDFRSAVKFLW